MSPYTLFPEDLDHILNHTRDLWEELRGRRIFITGGTGFFGMWLVESFLWANEKLKLGAGVTVLSRDPDGFLRNASHLARHEALFFHKGDVRSFAFPEENFSHVIHAATSSDAQLYEQDPLSMLDTIVEGTRRVLDFTVHCGARKFLLTSSGAVYGRQPAELTHVPEDYAGGPDPTDRHSAYGEGKRMAELLTVLYARQHGFEAKIARGFAFVGPYLPLDAHFAIGNFIRDALQGGPIQVNGDGTPYRSYLYAADLAIWLWTILFRGRSCQPYNLGSDEALTIREVAQAVANLVSPPIAVRSGEAPTPGAKASRYVPCVDRARRELGLDVSVETAEACHRTIHWCKAAGISCHSRAYNWGGQSADSGQDLLPGCI